MTDINKPMYGVWIPGKGWVRGSNNQAFGDYNKVVAQELAKRLGQGARVYYVDNALVDLEDELLKAEKRSNGILNWLHIIMALNYHRKNENEIDKER